MPFDEQRDGDLMGREKEAEQVTACLPAKSPTKSSAKGRYGRADTAVNDLPDALPTNDGKGQSPPADDAGRMVPDPSPDTEGHSTQADEAGSSLSSSDDDGLVANADEAIVVLPSSSPRKRRVGRRSRADKAGLELPNSASDGEDHPKGAVAAASELSSSSQSIRGDGGQNRRADRASLSALPSPESGEVGQPASAEKAGSPLPASPLIDQLAELQVRRKFYIGATNKQTNAVKALVRRFLGWRYDTEEADREKTNARAAKIVAAALAGKAQKPEDVEAFGAIAGDLAVVASAIEPLQAAREQVEKDMKKLARSLPVSAWAKGVHGLGELGLAVIIAEAGDLAKYPKKGHLWKRLGLAVHGDKAYSTWRMKGGLSAEEWTAAGYSPRRRAEVYAVISEPLFRAQSVAEGPYRAIYDRRRAATAIAHEDWTKAHSHMDGLRVMTKYLLRDLWQEWRRVKVVVPDAGEVEFPAAKPVCVKEAE